MTLLPMARHGRLAMLDGSLVSSMLLLCTGWLSGRSHPWHGLLAGLGIHGHADAQASGGAGISADHGSDQHHRPRQSRWHPQLWSGWSPAVLLSPWHLWHLSQQGGDALLMWGGQGLSRVVEVVGDSTGAWVMPLTEVLEADGAQLLLLPAGVIWSLAPAPQQRGALGTGPAAEQRGPGAAAARQLPWYSHLLWPSITLLCAEGLESVVSDGRPRWVGRIWSLLGALVLLGAVVVWGAQIAAAPSPPR